MASSPITLWQIDGETKETVTDFTFLGSKITADDDCSYEMKADGDCSYEMKRHFLLGRKAMTNLDSILKSRDITLSTEVHIGKAKVFTLVMYGYKRWIIKKAERWRIDAFKLWCWRRLLRVPWTARRPNQSIQYQSWIFIGRTDAEAEVPRLWPLDAENWLTGKDPDAGIEWRQKEKGTTEDEMVRCHHQLSGHEFEQSSKGDSEKQRSLTCCSPWGQKESDTTEQMNNNKNANPVKGNGGNYCHPFKRK